LAESLMRTRSYCGKWKRQLLLLLLLAVVVVVPTTVTH
jgi:hypothetical protein